MIEGIYGFQGDYHFLSNMYRSPGCTIDSIPVPTNEHRYQAFKAMNAEGRNFVLYKDLTSPSDLSLFDPAKFTSAHEAKRRGRIIPSDKLWWEENKIYIMLEGLKEKFSTPKLAEKLRATGDLYLEETNWWGDHFWGVCDGKGKNVLGLLLMQVRKELNN